MNDRIEELAGLIRYHQDKYYNDEPEISDAEFDALWDELQELAPDHELFATVGEDRSSVFPKREHLMPMGSQEKASSEETFLKWARRVGHAAFIVQYKLDGASIELQYRNGRFTYGVTRGDGTRGDDITPNVRRMQGVPQVLKEGFTGAVRGEVIMEHHIHERHFSDKANCRNAANGLMKRKDGVGSEYLRVLCYDAHSAGSTREFSTEEGKLRWLERQGFDIVPYTVFATAEEVVHYRDLVTEKRRDIDYDIDGLVVKGPEIDIEDMKRARPQKQIAFKFSAEEALTVLRDVEWSESGHLYTPVGIVDPVRLAGTTVRRASLVHPELIAEMGLKIGSEVIITKRGDIIPKIERLVRDLEDAREIEIPTRCETCGTELVNEGKRLYCPNPACPRRSYHRLRKWLDVLDIRDFGDVLLTKLFESGRVREIRDLYTLRWDEIARFEGMGEVSARKVLDNLYRVRTVPLARFVAGFDIGGIAELKIAKVVDAGFDTLDALRSAGPEALADAEGIARTTARQIVEGLNAVSDEMDRLLETGAIEIEAPNRNPSEGGPDLGGVSFCFTGPLTGRTRSEAEEAVRSRGGEVRTSVSGKLSYLVTNEPDSGSSKNRKARELGIPIISEEEFEKILAG
ncbi:MAG: NAD-dependent DNA ligase LigA [Alkalispirochaeta sp.]